MIPISGSNEVNPEFRQFCRLRQAIKDLRADDRLARLRTPKARDVHHAAFEMLNLNVSLEKCVPLERHLVDLLVDRGFDRKATALVVKATMDAPFLRD